ncbi:MAG: hypothetical protein QOH18_1574, partial [Solirubrobacterales bacterium]|nr:hypothetical protein [Solirubrobacterales bacterium]
MSIKAGIFHDAFHSASNYLFCENREVELKHLV